MLRLGAVEVVCRTAVWCCERADVRVLGPEGQEDAAVYGVMAS